MSFNCLKAKEPLQEDGLPFTTMLAEVTSWYSFEWPWKNKKLSQSWTHLVVLNPRRHLDCESNVVITKPLLQLETNMRKKKEKQ